MKIEKQNPGFAKRVKSWLTGKYVENGSTASQNIPAGKWVTWKGQMCRSKAAITTGDTLSATNLDTDEEGALNSKVFFPNYSRTILTKNVQSGSWTATEDCYIIAFVMATMAYSFTVNNISVGIHDDISGVNLTFFSGYLKKGDVINSGANWTAKAFALS